MRLSDGTSIDEWVVRTRPKPEPAPPISAEEARLMRLEAALAEVGARLEGLQLPPPQVNVPPVDLSEVVQAVAGIKSSDPDAIADAIAAKLQFPEPVPTDLSALTDLRSVLERMEHRLTGIGNQAFGSSGPSRINFDGAQPVQDSFAGGEILADQTGAGAALSFSFSQPVQLVWVTCDGGAGRADPFGGTPTATLGVPCADGTPTPLTVVTSAVKVYAAAPVVVSVWGFRYS